MIIYCTVLFSGKVAGYSNKRMNSDQIEVEVTGKWVMEEGNDYYYDPDSRSIYPKKKGEIDELSGS